MMPSAKIAHPDSAPPVNMLRCRQWPAAAWSKKARSDTVDAGHGNVGADPVDDQKAKVNQMR
jgi:hypothetical protein